MQKVVMKVFLEGSKEPLFECEIVDEAEKTVKAFEKKLNDRRKDTVRFGQICFKRSLFHHFEIETE